jgi:hypothetical protein
MEKVSENRLREEKGEDHRESLSVNLSGSLITLDESLRLKSMFSAKALCTVMITSITIAQYSQEIRRESQRESLRGLSPHCGLSSATTNTGSP